MERSWPRQRKWSVFWTEREMLHRRYHTHTERRRDIQWPFEVQHPSTISPRLPARPTSIMSSTLRPSTPLLTRASSQISTIKTTSLADLQSTLLNICTIINDLIATVHNLNAVHCANRKVSKHCLFVFGVRWSVYLTYYLLPHEKKEKKVESKVRRLLYVPEGPVHAKGERRVQKSSLPKVQSRMAGAEAKHFNVLAQSWRQYELQGVEHLSEVNETHLRSRKFCSPVEQIPVRHS